MKVQGKGLPYLPGRTRSKYQANANKSVACTHIISSATPALQAAACRLHAFPNDSPAPAVSALVRHMEIYPRAMLMKKWESIRDNYTREYKRQKKLPSGSGSSKHTPYIYYRKLQFLQSSTANNLTESNYETSESHNSGADNTENEDLMPRPKEHIERLRKKPKMNAVDKQIVEILEKSLAARQQNETQLTTVEEPHTSNHFSVHFRTALALLTRVDAVLSAVCVRYQRALNATPSAQCVPALKPEP
ncbi:hypothetical protein EVAR_3121_1 [Eumeta japonica]|uniref:MADF domain-containing protein n=1 Tax=Eumeta variegata TaxID=151549 RepID=A0A4C1XJE5_EUMVA|nr:hypothetical protein EVAR_3121_1 [Eumeta japonica]